jgi:hypothetical protein
MDNQSKQVWDDALMRSVLAKLKSFKKEGTVSIGFDCLLAHSSIFPKGITGAPQGGNLKWQYAQRLAAVCRKLPVTFRKMVLDVPPVA